MEANEFKRRCDEAVRVGGLKGMELLEKAIQEDKMDTLRDEIYERYGDLVQYDAMGARFEEACRTRNKINFIRCSCEDDDDFIEAHWDELDEVMEMFDELIAARELDELVR